MTLGSNFVLPLVLNLLVFGIHAALVEEERVKEFIDRKHEWPLATFQPPTEGWTNLMRTRIQQVTEMKDSGARYEGFHQTIHSASLLQNFTEHGFALAKCPDELLAALQKGIHDGLPTAGFEKRDAVIPGPNPPWMISRPDLRNRVLLELHSYAEEWAGIPLTALQAYGFRVYRNESSLFMHVDRKQTHVISFILHIDSSEDADPWPLFIEDFQGNTHEVVLTPGDILFYESSKCFHGRPRPLNGSWYTSVFVHYYPKENWFHIDHDLAAHYAIPPSWRDNTDESQLTTTPLEMVQTSFIEPGCPNQWCRTEDTIKWSGPAEHGWLTRPNQERVPFHPPEGKPAAATMKSTPVILPEADAEAEEL